LGGEFEIIAKHYDVFIYNVKQLFCIFASKTGWFRFSIGLLLTMEIFIGSYDYLPSVVQGIKWKMGCSSFDS